MPSKTGNSEYNRKYTSLMKHISIGDSTPQRDKTGSALKLPNHKIVEYASTYHVTTHSLSRTTLRRSRAIPRTPRRARRRRTRST